MKNATKRLVYNQPIGGFEQDIVGFIAAIRRVPVRTHDGLYDWASYDYKECTDIFRAHTFVTLSARN